jgi:hypothetical protein
VLVDPRQIEPRHLLWRRLAFKKDCTARCIAKGDEAVAAKKYESAIELYSAGIELDSSCESLFVQRSKANLERNLFAAALHDANRVRTIVIISLAIVLILLIA